MFYWDQTYPCLFQGSYIWDLERENVYCGYNNTMSIEPNKRECQRLCEQNPYCIGFSNANDGQNAHLCYMCLDDKLKSDNYGFNFYRKPGID